METTQILDWSQEAIRTALLLGGPLLAVALLAGLVIGAGQTLTQLHEPVVGQVPRMVAVAVALMVMLPWLVGRWAGFASALFDAIPGLVAGG